MTKSGLNGSELDKISLKNVVRTSNPVKNVKMWSILWLWMSFYTILIPALHHDWDIVTRNSNNFLYKGQMVRECVFLCIIIM